MHLRYEKEEENLQILTIWKLLKLSPHPPLQGEARHLRLQIQPQGL